LNEIIKQFANENIGHIQQALDIIDIALIIDELSSNLAQEGSLNSYEEKDEKEIYLMIENYFLTHYITQSNK
jgi:hypothetical protein